MPVLVALHSSASHIVEASPAHDDASKIPSGHSFGRFRYRRGSLRNLGDIGNLVRNCRTGSAASTGEIGSCCRWHCQFVEPGSGSHTAPRPRHIARGDKIKIDFPTIRAVYSGRIVSQDRIEGRWRGSGNDLSLVFNRGEDALAPLPPPGPLTKERLAELRLSAGSPAMAAASARGQSPVQVWVDGERAIGTGIAVQDTDLWHLGSITKSMTSSLVGCLADLGALHWEETVGDLLGPVAVDMRDDYRTATFRHLLCHRSGLPGNLPWSRTLFFSRELADAREERKLYVRRSLALAPVGPMTTTFEYSNNGYVVAGAMIETKLGKSWEDLITTHLFRPLGLSTAGFGAPGQKGMTDQPAGHTRGVFSEARQAYPVGGWVTDNPVVIGPAGRVHMSLQDLLRYLSAHRSRANYLKPETWKMLHTPPLGGDYAMGWFVRGDGRSGTTAPTCCGTSRYWLILAVRSLRLLLPMTAIWSKAARRSARLCERRWPLLSE